MISLESAVEVFVRGFQFTRSFTHPYLAERIASTVWRMHDAPRKRDWRGEEFVAWDTDAETLQKLAQAHAEHRFSISVIVREDAEEKRLRTRFKELDYRLVRTETFFAHPLQTITPTPQPYPVLQITTPEQAGKLAKAARRCQILPEYLTATPAPMRQYVASEGEAFVGWVGSVVVGDFTWCNNMYVLPSHRRQGIARALLTRMLSDDKAAGASASILLASHAGAKLYPVVGYEAIGKLLMFTPPKSLRTAV